MVITKIKIDFKYKKLKDSNKFIRTWYKKYPSNCLRKNLRAFYNLVRCDF